MSAAVTDWTKARFKVRCWIASRLQLLADRVKPLNKTEKERIQRLRNYAYQLQNRIDNMPVAQFKDAIAKLDKKIATAPAPKQEMPA